MQIFLVGGAVRDTLLGIPLKEKDYVVVGATPEELLSQGFQTVGKDFPVFLHPKTQEEYALARMERKSGKGYKGFSFDASPEVTLEEDLMRRDLTINAIAQDDHGNLIDPFHGQADLKNRILRHVSPAFVEDPLRVLRVARFAAQLSDFNFKIADETFILLNKMVRMGELNDLTPERVWKEFFKSLNTKRPDIFLDVLRKCGALAVLFPELDRLFGVPNSCVAHPEVDTGIHTLMVLREACKRSENPIIRFAALCHDLGKSETPLSKWPNHVDHEKIGVKCIESFAKRYRIPKDFFELAILVCRYHGVVHHLKNLKADEIIDLFDAVDAFRRTERFEAFLIACEADFHGRPGYEDRPYLPHQLLLEMFKVVSAVDVQAILEKGLKGEEIKREIYSQRVLMLRKFINQ